MFVHFCYVQGRVCQSRLQPVEAYEHYAQALAKARSLQMLKLRALICGDLADVAKHLRRRKESESFVAEAEGLRQQLLAENGDRALARSIVALPAERELDLSSEVVATAHGERRMRDPAREREAFELVRRRSRFGLPAPRADGDDNRRVRCAREGRADLGERGEGRLAVGGKRLVARLVDMQSQCRKCERGEQPTGHEA